MQDVKKFLPLLVAGILALAAVFLINIYLKQQAESTRQEVIAGQKNLVTVVVARQDIPANTMLSEQMLKEITISKDRMQPRAASSIDRVVNKITLAPLSRDEQVLLNKLTISGQEISLSTKVPRGKRAITIPVDNISSVGGMVRPGDHVDVMGMVPVPMMSAEGKQVVQMTTMPLFQDVLVLAVGQEFTTMPGEKKGEKTVSPVITLALAPQEANLIAFVQEQGRIRLVLRSPEDTQVQPPVPASWDTLFRTVMPQLAQQDEQRKKDVPAQPVKPHKTVEIYRGLQKEVKTIE
jgi:pilus assembly protein CpaB